MKLFLIADPSDSVLAQHYDAALAARGHRVSRRDNEQGGASSASVRKSIEGADFVIFLATPRSTVQGSVALSDLSYAHQQKGDAKGRILVLKTDGAVDVGGPMFKAFRSAGPLVTVSELASLVASEQGLASKGGRLWPAVAAGLVLAALVGGAAFYLAGQRDGAAGGGEDAAALPSRPGSDIEFETNVDYTETVSFGETRHLKLTQTAGSPFKFKCVAGPSPSPNIVAVSNDGTCANISVTASDGPFVDVQGNPYQIGYYHPDRDIVPVSIQTMDGQEVYRTQFPLQVGNGGSFLLRGLKKSPEEFPGDLRVLSVVEPGTAYDVEFVTKSGSPLPAAYSCSPSTRYGNPDYRLTPRGGCKFRLENAHPGSRQLSTTVAIVAKRDNPAFEIEGLFEVVGPDYESPTQGLSGTGVSPEQMLDGLRQFKTRMADWLERHQASTAPDAWYLDYLKQQIAETDVAIGRLGGGTPASPVSERN